MPPIKSRFYYHVLKRRLKQFRQLDLPLPEARALRDRQSARVFKMPHGVLAEPAQIAGADGIAGADEAPTATPPA